jgi:hypothetical protein
MASGEPIKPAPGREGAAELTHDVHESSTLTSPDGLRFPDVPRLELDQLL